METLIVNLWGGPSSGKTTMALRLAGELSIIMGKDCSVEYVAEYAKSMIWRGEEELMIHQPLVTEGQIGLLSPVGKCDIVVTDSPLEVGLVYAKTIDYLQTKRLITEWKTEHDTKDIHIFINRGDCNNFQEHGRIHTLEESLAKDQEILSFLKDRKLTFTRIEQDLDVLSVCREVLAALKKEKVCQEEV